MNEKSFMLKRFLISNGFYKQFVNNLFNMRKMTFDEFVYSCRPFKANISNMISYAFQWYKSQEGYRFWYKVFEKALNYDQCCAKIYPNSYDYEQK